MDWNGNSQHNGAASVAKAGLGIRKKQRHVRSILKEGLQAGLRASPEVLEKCKPKTALGAIVRGLILEAAKSKATPLKTLMSLIDWVPPEGEDAEFPDEPAWDWSPDGVWLTMPKAEGPETAAGADDHDPNHPARLELKRRLTRLVEAGEHEQVARIADVIRTGAYSAPEPPQPVSTA